jgi:hypothetical protein
MKLIAREVVEDHVGAADGLLPSCCCLRAHKKRCSAVMFSPTKHQICSKLLPAGGAHAPGRSHHVLGPAKKGSYSENTRSFMQKLYLGSAPVAAW